MDKKKVIQEGLAELHRSGRDNLGNALSFQLHDCDPEKGEFWYRCNTHKWMSNPEGFLHGGVSATVADHAMGLTANAMLLGSGYAVTADMNISYHRPIVTEKEMTIHVQVISEMSVLIRLRCEEYYTESPEKVRVSATATYYVKKNS